MNNEIQIFDNDDQLLNFQKLQMEYSTIDSRKQSHRYRRKIRQMLFKIRRNILDDIAIDEIIKESGLREWIQSQLEANRQQSWDTFTFTWDVSANDPFTVIQKEEWNKTGGGYDEHGFRTPPAFTEQEL